MPRLVAPVLPSGALRAREQPTLRAEGLALRPWAVGDASALVQAYQDPDIQHWHMRALQSEKEAEDWALSSHECWRAETDADWAVTDGSAGRLLGRAALRGIQPAVGFAEVSYWVLPTARGAGVATRAMERVARWALEELGLHRLELLHSVANEPSCHLARKVGFELEGMLRGALLHTDGWHDAHLHSRLAGDTLTPG